MTRLKSKLLSFNAQKAVPTKIYSPANCEELRIPFKTDKIAKVVGKLASIAPPLPRSLSSNGEGEAAEDQEGEKVDMISGVLIQNDFKISLMAPEDLKEYAGLTTTTIMCRQHLTLSAAGIDLIRWALEGTFGAIKESSLTDAAVDGKMNGNGTGHKEEADEEFSRTETKFTVMDCVNVLIKNGGRVEVEWEGNVINDGIADAVLAVLFTVESSPAAVRRKSLPSPLTSHTNPFPRILKTAHPQPRTQTRRRRRRHNHHKTNPPLQKATPAPHNRPLNTPSPPLPLPRSPIRRRSRPPHHPPPQQHHNRHHKRDSRRRRRSPRFHGHLIYLLPRLHGAIQHIQHHRVPASHCTRRPVVRGGQGGVEEAA